MQRPPVLISQETLKAIAESADAVEFGQTIDSSGGGYMDSVAATTRVVSSLKGRIRREREPRERVTVTFGDGDTTTTTTLPQKQQTETPLKRKRRILSVAAPPPPVADTIIKAPSPREVKRRNAQIQKAAEGLVSYSDVITASAASGENSRQRLKTLKTVFGERRKGGGGIGATASIKAIDTSLEVASTITRRARQNSYSSTKRKRNPSTLRQGASSSAASGALLNTKTIVTTLFKESLSRYVAEDLIPEEQAASWLRKYTKNRMTYSMNMRFFAAALVWIYISFGNKNVEPTMKVDEEFAKQMKTLQTRKAKIDELILIAKPVLTETQVSGASAPLEVIDADRYVLFTYAVWIVYNENNAYAIDSTFYEEEGEDYDAEEAAAFEDEGEEGEGEDI